MVTTVIKRNGTEVPFEKQKIIDAVTKAFEVSDNTLDEAKACSEKIAQEISNSSKTSLSVEDIQDLVEKKLMASSYKNVAKSYINYRYLRTMARSEFKQFWDAIGEKLRADNVQNQNANVDEHSFGGRRGEASSVVDKHYALEYIVSPMAKANHENNEIYIHDLDSYAVGMHNCLSVPFDDLLKTGFNTRQTDVRPAGSVNTAFQLVAVIFQIQSLQQFGGVSATHLDWTMVPYVRKSFMKHYILEYIKQADEFLALDLLSMSTFELDAWVDEHKHEYLEKFGLTEEDFTFENRPNLDKYLSQAALFETIKETHQAVEGMYHNLNTLQSRSGNQLPFSSINYGTCTIPEGRMVTKELLEVSIEGLGALHKTSIFPCGIFQYMKGVNDKKGTPNYDLYQLALKSTAKRLYPNYANVDWSGNAGYDINDPRTYFSTMGCRTANGFDINGFGQLKDGRGNICPVTIIMPTLAMEAKEKNGDIIENFMEILDKKIHEAKDMLNERFNWICEQDPASAKFMYENGTMAGYIPEEGIRSALKHGTLAIGQLGLAETLQILIGCDHTTEKGMELAKEIEALFKKRCAEFKEVNHLNYGVYYTPAENLCYTAMKKFKAKYGEIPNVSDRDYFTNSMHIPVWHELDPFEKIDLEAQLTGYSSAGCITYVELDASSQHNTEALEKIVNYAMDKDIPYFAINVPSDTCLDCGWQGEINGSCPRCGSDNVQRLRRVTGYLTGDYKTAFNHGKQKEVEDRVRHEKVME